MNPKLQKALNIAQKVFTIVIIAITVFMMVFTIFSVVTFDKNDRSIFGFKFYIVQTDSMSLSDLNKDDPVHFNAGDLIIVKEVSDKKTLVEGDIISFISQNSDSFGETITHRIRKVTRDAEGGLAFKTYGTNTNTDDESLVPASYVLGVYTAQLPIVGQFFGFLKTTPGYIVCILIPFLILIIYQGVNCIRIFRRYKKEQMDEMQQERAKIEEERRQSEQMLRELEALKAQLAQQANLANAEPSDKEDNSADN